MWGTSFFRGLGPAYSELVRWEDKLDALIVGHPDESANKTVAELKAAGFLVFA